MKNRNFLSLFFIISLALAGNTLFAMQPKTRSKTHSSTVSIAVNPKNPNELAIARHAIKNGQHLSNQLGILDLQKETYTVQKNMLPSDREKKLTKVTFDNNGKVIPICDANKAYNYNESTKQFDITDAPTTEKYRLTESTKERNAYLSINYKTKTILNDKTHNYSNFAVNSSETCFALFSPKNGGYINLYSTTEKLSGEYLRSSLITIQGLSALAFIDDHTLAIAYEDKIVTYTLDPETLEGKRGQEYVVIPAILSDEEYDLEHTYESITGKQLEDNSNNTNYKWIISFFIFTIASTALFLYTNATTILRTMNRAPKRSLHIPTQGVVPSLLRPYLQ